MKGDVGPSMECSLGKVEARVGRVGARLQPNINTGAAVKQGSVDVKLLGFGGNVGKKGMGLSTPLGSFGFGKF